MRLNRYSMLAIGLIATAQTAIAQGGSTGMTFLTLGVGSRSLGMAEAYATAAGDPAAMQYNPATLTSIDVATISFMHRAWIQGTNAEFLAGAFDFGTVSLGLSVYSVSTDDIEVRDTPGPAVSTFAARNAALGLTLGYAVSPELSLGVTVKYLYEKILIDDARGTGFDLGAVYATSFGVRIGAAVVNLGSMSELGDHSTQLPGLFRGGLSYTTDIPNPSTTLTASVDLLSPLGDGTSHVHLGAEAVIFSAISVRAGYQTGYEARGFTAGTGVREGIVAVDYAFMPTQYDLGSTHSITLSLQLP